MDRAKLTEQDIISVESTKQVILGDYKGRIAEDRKATFESIKKDGIKKPVTLYYKNPPNGLEHNIQSGFCRVASAELLNIPIPVEYIHK